MSTLLERSLTKGRYAGDFTLVREVYDDQVRLIAYQCQVVPCPIDPTAWTALEDDAVASLDATARADGTSTLSIPHSTIPNVSGLLGLFYRLAADHFPDVWGQHEG